MTSPKKFETAVHVGLGIFALTAPTEFRLTEKSTDAVLLSPKFRLEFPV